MELLKRTGGKAGFYDGALRWIKFLASACVWLCCVVSVQSRIQTPANKEKPFASITYTAVAKSKAALPCDISAPSPDDSVTLVLWYKDESLAPIYTLDSRRGHVAQALQSSVPDMAKRAHFNMANDPAFLQIDPVEEADAGEYRCRVDFRKARSVNTVINLRVIVPPGEPVIMDDGGRRLEGLVGRFNEGENLRLVCEVEGGKPRPVLTWWRDKRLVDANYTFVGDGSVARNKFEIEELKRSDFLTVLTCQAANNNVTVAVSRSITLDMNLIPLDVAIQLPKRPLSAGKPVEVVCSSSGSRPPAVLTWWKSGEQLYASKEHQVQEGVSTSSSTILFTPAFEDNGLVLSCRAENQFIPGSAIEEGWKLDVFYKPRIALHLGQNLKEHDIREGRDVYLECHVDSSPPPTEVTWYFEGQEVTTNISAGMIVSNQSLVLQRVRRDRKGRYTCAAANREGHGSSNVFLLRIKFAPVCKAGQKLVYGVSRMDSVSVRCELEADPADVTFHWRFNSSFSSRSHVLSDHRHALTQSTITYVPHDEDDYGILYCWGGNHIGKQVTPCNFTIVPAVPPDPLSNCTQVNGTEESVSFECSGIPLGESVPLIVFLAELYDLDTDRLVANATSTTLPAFTFVGLPGGTLFRVLLHTLNAKAHTTPATFIVSTLRPAEKLSGGSQAIIIIRPIIGIILGILAAIVIGAVGMKIFVTYKHTSRTKDNDKKSEIITKNDMELFSTTDEREPDILSATPNIKTHLAVNDERFRASDDYTKAQLAEFYTHTAASCRIPTQEKHSLQEYCQRQDSPNSDLAALELMLSASSTSDGTPSASGLSRLHRAALGSITSTGYSRFDFQRNTTLESLQPGCTLGTYSDDDDDGSTRLESNMSELLSGGHMESIV